MPTLAISVPIPHIDIAGSLLSAIDRLLTSGVQAIASWAFDGMTSALLATTNVNMYG